VAQTWERYDLRRKIEAEWPELGPKLTNQLHVYVGDDDTFFLNLGVELFQEAVEQLDNPAAGAEFIYGPNQPHCWSPYTAPQLLDQMADHIVAQAPGAAGTQAWATSPRSATPRGRPEGAVRRNRARGLAR
jgi:hypothetical protein